MANVYRALIQGLIGLLQAHVEDAPRDTSSMDLVIELTKDYFATRARVQIEGYTLADILACEATALDEYLHGNADKSASLRNAIIWQTIANETVKSA